MNRRTFLFLAGMTLLTPGALLRGRSEVGLPRRALGGASPLQRLDIDEIAAKVHSLGQRIEHGADLQQAAASAQSLSAALWQSVSLGEIAISDPLVAATTLSADMLLAAIQEATLGWWQDRPRITGDTYGRLTSLLDQTRDPGLRRHRGRIDVRRAVLLREAKQSARAVQVLDVSFAAEEFDLRSEDDEGALLLLAAHCQRIHTYAVQGRRATWHRELSILEEATDREARSDSAKRRLLNVIQYTRGVGYKRFMWEARAHPKKRSQFAQESFTALSALQSLPDGARAVHDINLYHPSLPFTLCEPELASSAADALVWLWPEEAERQLRELQADGARRYPSVLRKIAAQLTLARRLLP